MRKVVLVAAKRTPIGSFMGSLSEIKATTLGAIVVKDLLTSIKLDPLEVDEVFMGHVLQAGTGQAPTRQVAINAGLPNTVPCTTINKVCASGMKSIMLGVQTIKLGDAEIVIAGGMESMSMSPHFVSIRKGKKFGELELKDTLQNDGLIDSFDQVAMGVFADKCAKKYKISREEQDNFAIESYKRSFKAWEEGKFDDEIVSVKIKKGRENLIFDKDEEFRNVLIEKISNLKPSFSKDGTATAANSSTINDGAAAVVLMSEEKALSLGIKPMAYLISQADASVEPSSFTTAPSKALPIAIKKAGLRIDQIDYFEINEAFSVVGLANAKILGIDLNKMNINGGAVSLGHPIGCSGARIVVSLVHILQKNGLYGAAGICNGGGGASAVIIKRYSEKS
ncbi:MAG: thiolase family protein [Bacteroidota bacterium]|nr:thiolase family protein [Bacteroidota bacterium]